MTINELETKRYTALSRPLTRNECIEWLTNMGSYFQSKGMIVVSIMRPTCYKNVKCDYICYRAITDSDYNEKRYIDFRQGMIKDLTFMDFMSRKSGSTKSGHNVKINGKEMIDIVTPDEIRIKDLTGLRQLTRCDHYSS